jgi:tetraacyldisaccharide 4'-kinase
MSPEGIWSSRNPVALLLLPLSLVFAVISALRRLLYRLRLLKTHRFDVPVIIVGNISVGGTGKTPLVIWLSDHLAGQGWRPGIVSRGYGGMARHWPQQVRADSDPAIVGDEAVMLAARTGCPMCVGPDRAGAVAALLAHTDVDIVISDDGMQHYALGRDLEIAVIDGERRLGNGFLLPAGPLREPRSRLKSVDMVVVNGEGRHGEHSMMVYQPVVSDLRENDARSIEVFAGQSVHAVAGIGNPQRFFDLLADYGLQVTPHPFPDHHRFEAADLHLEPQQPIFMTEKDAVKCRRFACENCWVVHIDVQPDASFVHRLNTVLKEFSNGQKASRHPGVSDL